MEDIVDAMKSPSTDSRWTDYPSPESLSEPSTTAWNPVRLPFFKPREQLPAPLPTEKEILESTTVLRPDPSYHRVVEVGEHFVVKHGRGVQDREGQTLLFLEKHLGDANTTLPKLHAMYRGPSNGHLFLIMQRIPGETLEALWPSLSEMDKTAVCRKLRGIFDTIRDIPAPNFYGTIERGPLPHHLFYSHDGHRAICGPFDSEQELNGAFVRKLRAIWTANGKHSFKADFYERNLNAAFLNGGHHRPVLTHSDLQRKNVVVRRRGRDVSSEASPTADGDFEVALIDWEDAGWYPTYWEYAAVFVELDWADDWPQRLEEVVDPWPGEAAILRMLYQDLWF